MTNSRGRARTGNLIQLLTSARFPKFQFLFEPCARSELPPRIAPRGPADQTVPRASCPCSSTAWKAVARTLRGENLPDRITKFEEKAVEQTVGWLRNLQLYVEAGYSMSRRGSYQERDADHKSGGPHYFLHSNAKVSPRGIREKRNGKAAIDLLPDVHHIHRGSSWSAPGQRTWALRIESGKAHRLEGLSDRVNSVPLATRMVATKYQASIC